MRDFSAAVKKGDRKFLDKVYGGWFDTAGFPKDQKEQFFHAISQDLGRMLSTATPEEPECFDDFCVIRLKESEGDGEFSLTFRKSNDSWVYFNERSNFSRFKKVYAIGYQVDGDERPGILFNGRKSPVLMDIGSSGFVSLINAAIKPGENEITILPSKNPVNVSIRISSAKEGEMMDSAQGDVLAWEGIVKEPVRLKFRAE